MCGFITIFEPHKMFDNELLQLMNKDLYHRGPDSGHTINEKGFALAFRRLAIMDPQSHADQPMSDPTERYTLVFNGEIYNYKNLREQLMADGIVFRTNGDTEVLLQGWIHWGESLLERLEGMYSFVIVDRVLGKAWIARDPLGIKPLYMLNRNGLIAFASEIRPLTRLISVKPNTDALAELLVFRFAAGSLSNLDDIDRIPSGTLLQVDLDSGAIKRKQFCDLLATFCPDFSINFEEAVKLSKQAVEDSIRAHLQSDVGFALQLSGGVDSSLVAAIAASSVGQRLTSYGVRLPGYSQDESEYQKMVVEQYDLDHHEVTLSGIDFADAWPDVVDAIEGPSSHYGCVMLYLLCKRVANTHKVVLSGEGADEMFGGYMRYRLWRQLENKGKMARLVPPILWPLLQRYREIQRYAGGRDAAIYASVYHDFLLLQEMFPGLFPSCGQREEVAQRFKDFRTKMFAIDQTSYLESLLLRQDKLGMASSVEVRVPYTHFPLTKVVNQFPNDVRAPGGDTKAILKRIAKEYLPKELIERRKVGLALPLNEWLNDPDGIGRYLDMLTVPNSRLATFAEPGRLQKVVNEFRKGEKKFGAPLINLINIELWLRSLNKLSAN